jgi:hypothetical protein
MAVAAPRLSGTFMCRDDSGEEHRLALRDDLTCDYSRTSHNGRWAAAGTFRVEWDILVVKTEWDSGCLRDTQIATFYVVPWGERTYLIHDMQRFCEAVNAGIEPRRTREGLFYVQEDSDFDELPEGTPEVDECFAPMLEEISCRIDRVQGEQHVRLALEDRQSVPEGTRFFRIPRDLTSLRVIESRNGSARAAWDNEVPLGPLRLRFRPMMLREGEVLTTRILADAALQARRKELEEARLFMSGRSNESLGDRSAKELAERLVSRLARAEHRWDIEQRARFLIAANEQLDLIRRNLYSFQKKHAAEIVLLQSAIDGLRHELGRTELVWQRAGALLRELAE